jgi:lysophospholipase L1-like esterase
MKIIKLLIFILSLIAVKSLWAQITIMPLGDSITRGSLSTNVNGYRRALKDLLVSSGYDVNFVGSLRDGAFVDNQHEGHSGFLVNQLNVSGYLATNPAQIVLLHIGTNNITPDGLYTTPNEVADLLDEIDNWETANNKTVIVVLAEIINRLGHTCPNSSETTTFNNNVKAMALNRINDPVKPDRIVIVDMECSAELNYNTDLADTVHPNDNGYEKMAAKWFADGLLRVLPQADAGADQNVDEKTLVTLDGSGSEDPDGTNLYYWWQQLSAGTAVTLSDPSIQKPTFMAPATGSNGERLEFELTVTDADGFDHSDNVFIDVGNVLILPEADAGPDQSVTEGETVTLDGSNSHDPDGTISSVQWEQVPGGTQVTLATPNDLITEFEAPEVDAAGETLTFKLTIRDNDDLVNTDLVTIAVQAKEAPIADAGPDRIVAENKIIILDGSNSFDPDHPDAVFSSVQWEQITGKNQVTLMTPDKLTTEFTAPEVDSDGDVLTFKLTVRDSDDLVGSDLVTVTVTNGEAPIADAGTDQTVEAGKMVILNGSNSRDPDGTITQVQWQQVAGQNQVALTMPNDLTTEFKAPDVDSIGDTLAFKLMIKDNDDLVSEDIVNVTVTPATVSAASSNGGGSGGGGCFIQSVMNQ